MIASNFLVPNGTLIVEVAAFLVVLFVIRKYVLPVVNRALEERQEQIRSSLEAAESARAEADVTRAQRQEILEEARRQGREIVAQANAVAERLRTEAQQRGQQEFDRLVASADADIALARQRALEELSTQVGALVVSAARQVVGREIDEARHRDLIEEAVAALHAAAEAAPAASGSQG
jgi:F-type H+-transporting ATPase subunit b